MIALTQAATPLLTTLQHCARQKRASFHTPGHKGGQGSHPLLQDWWGRACLQADLPELPELDNLFVPQSVIQQAQDLAAEAFGAEQTWFLVNGSTCGVIAAILATCNPGEYIVLPRNCHQSVISGLVLAGAVPVFVEPDYDPTQDLAYSVTPAAIEAALSRYPEARAVLLVHPTYHGVVGQIEAVACIVHRYGIPLLVDEAHGPHFAFHPDLPVAALAAGADLSVQSTHKVLSALTQAAMLHVQGSRIDRDRLSQALRLLQSTSPNYLLLASLDAARQQMALRGDALMTRTLNLAAQVGAWVRELPGLSILEPKQDGKTPGFAALDATRLTVTVAELGLSGFEADTILHEQFGVTAELPTLRQLTFILSLGNTPEEIRCLMQALTQLAQHHRRSEPQFLPSLQPERTVSVPERSPREAFLAPKTAQPLEQTVGRVSAELVCPYPPGIPILVPGERITAAAVDRLHCIQKAGGVISGCVDPALRTVLVVQD